MDPNQQSQPGAQPEQPLQQQAYQPPPQVIPGPQPQFQQPQFQQSPQPISPSLEQYQQPMQPSYQPSASPFTTQTENVAMGLLGASISILIGIVSAVLLWKLGFIASISSFAIAASAIWLYQFFAKSKPVRGAYPLIGVIIIGVVASFFSVVAFDLYTLYDNPPIGYEYLVSRTEFITSNILNGELLAEYGGDIAMFVLFAVLGVAGAFKTIIQDAKGQNSTPQSFGQ